jgi:hypothetical protein
VAKRAGRHLRVILRWEHWRRSFDRPGISELSIEAMKQARRGKLDVVTLDEIQAVLDADD